MYLDSAIIVKLLVREAGSDWFSRNLSGHSFESSELSLTEVGSALLAKERAADITANERMAARNKFFSMIEDELIRLFPLNRAVLERAGAIQLACHPHIPLRTLDALHIATCDMHKSGPLSTTDGKMRAACAHFAIALVPERMEELT